MTRDPEFRTRTLTACDKSAARDALEAEWLHPITAKIADVSDEEAFPEFARARRHARKLKQDQ